MLTAKQLFTTCFPRATLSEEHHLLSRGSTQYVYFLPDNLGSLSITERSLSHQLILSWSLPRSQGSVFQHYSLKSDQLKLLWGTHTPPQPDHTQLLTAPLPSLRTLLWHFFAILAKGNQYNPLHQPLPSFASSSFASAQRLLTLCQQHRLPKRDASPSRSGRSALKTATNSL